MASVLARLAIAVGIGAAFAIYAYYRDQRYHSNRPHGPSSGGPCSPSNGWSSDTEDCRNKNNNSLSSGKANSRSSTREIYCPICLESISDLIALGVPVSITECGHYFRELCIRNWLRTNRACPTCRKTVCQEDLKRVIRY